MRTDFGELTDLDAVDRLVSARGLDLIEVGCAGGDMARHLADRGATVLGIEPDAVQAEQNRSQPPTPGVTLVEAAGEELPAEDNSVDGVLFFRSLHHVPPALMDKALGEAARVLKPGGFLYVAEPSMEGSNYAMTRLFNDETEKRTLAQQALDRTAARLFEETGKYVYMLHPRRANLESMAARIASRSFNRIAREMIDVPEVRKHFEAARSEGGYVFDQPMLVNMYRHDRG
jgi:ubiquinone/menaquinone biosynthesis C-methylase UbiE